MIPPPTTLDKTVHKKIAQDLFHRVWDLMEQPERSDYETLVMIHMAHASLVHWSYLGEAVNMARGEWQVSRVYAMANKPESALYHGLHSLGICQRNAIGDFDLAFAYEAVARAQKLLGRTQECQEYHALAKAAAEGIGKSEDKAHFLRDLMTLGL